jgi:hypothetical protein
LNFDPEKAKRAGGGLSMEKRVLEELEVGFFFFVRNRELNNVFLRTMIGPTKRLTSAFRY